MSSYSELMGKTQVGVDPTAIAELSALFVVDAVVQHEQNQVMGEYDERVAAGVCTPLEEVFSGDESEIIREFVTDMGQAGFRGAAAMNPPKKQAAPTAPAAPVRSKYALTVEDAAQPEVLAVSRLRAAFTGKVPAANARPVIQEPTHGRTYPIGTTEAHIEEETQVVAGTPWTSGRPLPRLPVIVIRGDAIEVGTVRGALSADGNIVPDRTDTPLPVEPGTEFRLGLFGSVMPLTFVEQIEMSDEVRTQLPPQPRGAIFHDTHGDVGLTMALVAKRALQGRPTRAVVPGQRIGTPVVAREPFPSSGKTAGTEGVPTDAGVVEVATGRQDDTVVLEGVTTTPNGHVPAPRTGEQAEDAAAK